MKTEPTINIQDEVVKIHAQYGMSEMANYQIEKLFEKYVEQFSLKVKQLEWRGDVAHRIKTNTSIGEYEVYKSINGDYLFYIDNIKATTITFNSLEKAKAFAQADFEARVKGCLIIE